MADLSIKTGEREWLRRWPVTVGAALAVVLTASGMIHEWRQQATGFGQGAAVVNGPVSYGAMTPDGAPVHGAFLSASHAAGGASMAGGAATISTAAAASTGAAAPRQTATVFAAHIAGREIIESVSLEIRTRHVDSAFQTLQSMVAAAGGFVQNSQESGSAGQTVWLTTRVPAADLPPFLNRARHLGRVLSFSQSGQDVTQQDQNLAANIAELKQEAAAYTRLFDRAQTMKDMLAVQQALVQVNSQLTDLEQQSQGLSRLVAMATVQVTLTPPSSGPVQPSPAVNAWLQFCHQTGASALAVVDLIAWVLPWAALLFAIGFGTRVLLRRRTH